MPKPHSILAEESLQKQAAEFINKAYQAPYYKPVYYSDELETTYMRLFHKVSNELTRYRRFLSSFYMQEYFTPVAESSPKLRKKLILVTGGSSGVGFETALKLVVLGATVIVASNNLYKADRAALAIRALLALGSEKMDFVLSNLSCNGPEGILDAVERYQLRKPVMLVDQEEDAYGEVHSIFMNLSDLKTVADAVAAIGETYKGKTLDHVVLAASICPEDNVFSLQGHEIAFSTNVLGHFALINLCIQHKMLRIESQVAVLGCEDYFLADDCTTDFSFPEEEYGFRVYRRSKLGQFWMARELQKRYSYLSVCIVHPGYCDTRLGMDSLPVSDRVTSLVVLSPRSAANVVVICVQFSSTLPKAVYYHNTCGQMILDPREHALNDERAAAFWDMLSGIYTDYMRLHNADHQGYIANRSTSSPTHYSDTLESDSNNGNPRYIALN